jgi:hypothetical protein
MELREWLNAARQDLPTNASLQALGLVVPPPPPAPPLAGPEAGAAAQAANAGALLSTGKMLAIVTVSVAAVVAGGAAFFALSTEPPTAVNSKPAAAPLESAVVDEVPVLTPSVEATTPAPVLSSAASAVNAPPVATGSVNEVGLLRQARGALSQRPERALELLRRHQREFPSSNFEQEREVIRIEALRRLGRTQEAERLGEAFEQKFPNSAHKNRLDRGTP